MTYSKIYWLDTTNISCTLFKRTIYDALLRVYSVKSLFSDTAKKSGIMVVVVITVKQVSQIHSEEQYFTKLTWPF